MTPSPQPSTSSSAPNEEAERLLQFRTATNFRTVQRNDPAVTEIIETSVYSVIYHYDEPTSKWTKLKQEGSLFIVRRDKAPENALFMLNRQTVKNVLIPLVPGEMKVTIVDDAMIQVTRRKQTPHTGIWFSEGAEAVSRFRGAILRICGEPSAPPGAKSTPTPAAPSPTTSETVPPLTGDDGISRLFAGLMKSNPVQSPPSVQPTVPNTTQITTTTTSTTTQSTIEVSLPKPATEPSQPLLYDHTTLPNHASPPPSMSTESVHPPGQTVDDLLMSILGLAQPSSATTAPNAISSPSTLLSPDQRAENLRQESRIAQFQPQAHSLPPAQPPKRSQVGDATFAQAAGSISPPSLPAQHHPPPFPASEGYADRPLLHNQVNSLPNIHQPPFMSPQQREPSNSTTPSQTGHVSQQPNLAPGFGENQFIAPIMDHSRMATRDAVLDGLVSKQGFSVIGDDGRNDYERKGEFVRGLLALVHTDPRFVDEIWAGYLARMGGSRGHPG